MERDPKTVHVDYILCVILILCRRGKFLWSGLIKKVNKRVWVDICVFSDGVGRLGEFSFRSMYKINLWEKSVSLHQLLERET